MMKSKELLAAAAVVIGCCGNQMPAKAYAPLPMAKNCTTLLSNLRITMERINTAGRGSPELTEVQQQTLKETTDQCDSSWF